ncbi:MAG: sigma-54 dependent transcriptional regulator [candidate division KSB1 bacterium]|nr:sigma-54 dependent transcriptional regulator [candidate division KSB1 bacterium]
MNQILLIEDNDTMRQGMALVIEKMGHQVIQAADGQAGLKQLTRSHFDLVVTDYKMAGLDGLEVLKQVKALAPETEVMIITAYGTIELAVSAMKQGAADFITKPFSHDEFRIKVQKLLERIQERAELRRISDENLYLRSEWDIQFNYGEIVGDSAAMKEVYRTIEKVAATDSSVLIYGESGTGKELVARAIHKASNRKDKPFIRVNCGALAEGVLESELFGHERGAFTGALKRKRGRFELAHRGTIFLDEIGDIPPSTQLKLLRVLQEREFERVGGEETLQVDVRIIAATNKNLKEAISLGKFREDLYYRLHIIPIYMPPLRDHKEDIPILVSHFLKKIGAELKKPALELEEKALQRLLEYHWPGNVRELENILERAAVLCENNRITLADLPVLVKEKEHQNALLLEEENLELNRVLEDVERQLLEKALEKSKGVKTEAARLLGIKTSALYYKLEKYGLL